MWNGKKPGLIAWECENFVPLPAVLRCCFTMVGTRTKFSHPERYWGPGFSPGSPVPIGLTAPGFFTVSPRVLISLRNCKQLQFLIGRGRRWKKTGFIARDAKILFASHPYVYVNMVLQRPGSDGRKWNFCVSNDKIRLFIELPGPISLRNFLLRSFLNLNFL